MRKQTRRMEQGLLDSGKPERNWPTQDQAILATPSQAGKRNDTPPVPPTVVDTFRDEHILIYATGNLNNSVAAPAARVGRPRFSVSPVRCCGPVG